MEILTIWTVNFDDLVIDLVTKHILPNNFSGSARTASTPTHLINVLGEIHPIVYFPNPLGESHSTENRNVCVGDTFYHLDTRGSYGFTLKEGSYGFQAYTQICSSKYVDFFETPKKPH